MTTPYPGPQPSFGGFPAPTPSSPGDPAGTHKPRGKALIISGSVLVGVAVIAGIIAIVALVGIVTKPGGYHRVAAGDQRTVHLDAGKWVVYYESAAEHESSTLGRAAAPPVRITGPDGQRVNLGYYLTDTTYDIGDRHGVAIYTFSTDHGGDYTVEVGSSSTPGSGVAIGHSLLSGVVGWALLIVAAGLLFVLGLVLLIVGLVIRSRSKRDMARYGSYGGPSVPYGPPGGGFGAPPGYAPAGGGWGPPTAPPPPPAPPPPAPPPPPHH